jgi:hypothetical protein
MIMERQRITRDGVQWQTQILFGNDKYKIARYRGRETAISVVSGRRYTEGRRTTKAVEPGVEEKWMEPPHCSTMR